MDYSYKYTSDDGWRKSADSVLPCTLHGVGICIAECIVTLCTFFIFLPFLTSLHLFTNAKHYFALIFQCGVARCPSNNFSPKRDFDHFDLILYKRFSCEILFSDFVYLLLDRITFEEISPFECFGWLKRVRMDYCKSEKGKL